MGDRYFIAGIDVSHGSYPICDSATSRRPIARCEDGDMAHRICALLNADEAAKETVRKAGIRKRLMNRTSIGMPNEI